MPDKEKILTTSHLARKYNMTQQKLRRILRSMPRYDDDKPTQYLWKIPGDEEILKEIDIAIRQKKEKDLDKSLKKEITIQ